MNLVSVTRILNEDDIVEAFVRHHARALSHMVFLDNGSSDGTIAILKALQAEGLPLTVFQGESVIFDEVNANTWLYRLADQMHKADWVIFLDADEFISLPANLTLTMVLNTQAARAVEAMLLHYQETPEDDAAELVVPKRMRWRHRDPTYISKIFLRGGYGPRVVVDAGNHGAFLDGKAIEPGPEPRIGLAHYPRRDRWQDLQKVVTGWLKVLATGQAATELHRSAHYQSPFEALRDAPAEVLGGTAAPPSHRAAIEEKPLRYLGGALRYTTATDPAPRALALSLRYAEQLARQHGKLLDQSAEARRLVEAWTGGRKFLF